MSDEYFLTIDSLDYEVMLDDSPMARQFAQMLPFQASATTYADCHYWGSAPERIALLDEYKTSMPKEGDLYYADHLQAFAVYFDKSESIAPYEIFHIGTIKGDLPKMKNLSYHVECTFHTDKSRPTQSIK